MDINITGNNGSFDALKFAGLEATPPNLQTAKPQNTPSPTPLTVTEQTATPEDIAAAAISDAALTRDDALGKLVSSAFALPPPPMPNFV